MCVTDLLYYVWFDDSGQEESCHYVWVCALPYEYRYRRKPFFVARKMKNQPPELYRSWATVCSFVLPLCTIHALSTELYTMLYHLVMGAPWLYSVFPGAGVSNDPPIIWNTVISPVHVLFGTESVQYQSTVHFLNLCC